MAKKEKDYQKVWEIEEGYAWVLFMGDQAAYHTGVALTKAEAEWEIKWILAGKERENDLSS